MAPGDLKAVILAGGFGTRISEESHLRPKPMVEIGGQPILWHIMKSYAGFGVRDFVICLGYRGYVIKEYFANYFLHRSDVTFDLRENKATYHVTEAEDWSVTLVDTGLNTLTGGRIARVQDYLDADKPFFLTYGDGVSDVDIDALLAFHKDQGRTATLTAVAPPGRFGALELDNGRVAKFDEKPSGDGSLINGGFFVCEPDILNRIAGDDSILESDVLTPLATDNQLSAFTHRGFWHPMDTMRDRQDLERLWASGKAPWKNW